jgi:hypothetical protein
LLTVPAPLYFPLAHALQPVRKPFSYLPATQFEQVTHGDELYFPAPHREHDDALELLTLPLAQLEQEMEPALLLYFPLAQSSHAPMPAWLA